MSDEAVVRIILQDSGRAAGGGGSSAAGAGGTVGGPKPFDPLALARERIRREDERAAVDAEYLKLRPPPPPKPDPPFDPVEVAKKRVERENQRAAVEAEYLKLRPPPPKPPFDPLEVAKKRLKREQEMAAADAEYAKLSPPKPFNPADVARRRRERERRGALADVEYNRMYGEDDEQGSFLNDMAGAIHRLRGTIGGVFGTLTGATLDIVSGASRRSREDKHWRKRADLLAEAQAPEVLPPEQVSLPAEPFIGPIRPEEAEKIPTAELVENPKPPTAVGGGGGGTGAVGWKGGGSTVAAMGGPVALAFAAKEVIDTIGRTVVGAVRGAGELMTGVLDPSTDASRSVMFLADTTAKAGAEMAKISPVVGFTVEAFGEAGKAIAGLMRNIDQFATRYGEYSPLIAQQQAIVEIRQVMGDMRRAREAETSLARYVQLQGDLQQKFEDIKVKLLTKVLETLMPILQILEQVMPSDSLVAVIGALLAPLRAIAEGVATITGIQVASDLNDRMRAVEDPTVTLLSVDNGQRNFGEAAGD